MIYMAHGSIVLAARACWKIAAWRLDKSPESRIFTGTEGKRVRGAVVHHGTCGKMQYGPVSRIGADVMLQGRNFRGGFFKAAGLRRAALIGSFRDDTRHR